MLALTHSQVWGGGETHRSFIQVGQYSISISETFVAAASTRIADPWYVEIASVTFARSSDLQSLLMSSLHSVSPSRHCVVQSELSVLSENLASSSELSPSLYWASPLMSHSSQGIDLEYAVAQASERPRLAGMVKSRYGDDSPGEVKEELKEMLAETKGRARERRVAKRAAVEIIVTG